MNPWQTQLSWWFPINYTAWNLDDDVEWIKDTSNLPDVKSLIEITRPQDGSQWLGLNGYFHWEQPTPADVDSYNVSRRNVWYMIRGYLVEASQIDELFAWALEQDFKGSQMPEPRELYELFLGEFFWASPYEHFSDPSERTVGWQGGGENSEIPIPIMHLTEGYLKESSGFDCSIDEAIRITLPCAFVIEHMGLNWRGVEGSYFDLNGNLVAFDPSVREAGPNQLLLKRDSFLKFLKENNLTVFWTMTGEKQIIGKALNHQKWTGRMTLTGAFRLTDEQVVGAVKSRFDSPEADIE